MKRIISLGTVLSSLLFSTAICTAAEGYKILFKDSTSKLSKQEKQQIYKKLGFQLSKNRKFIIVNNWAGDISPRIDIVDLNGDGVEEVFVYWGNSRTSGNSGRSVNLFIKDRNGQFIKHLGYPTAGIDKLPTRNKGFPDLLIGGSGFCFGVHQWTGTNYKLKCCVEDIPGGCKNRCAKKICK